MISRACGNPEHFRLTKVNKNIQVDDVKEMNHKNYKNRGSYMINGPLI